MKKWQRNASTRLELRPKQKQRTKASPIRKNSSKADPESSFDEGARIDAKRAPSDKEEKAENDEDPTALEKASKGRTREREMHE